MQTVLGCDFQHEFAGFVVVVVDDTVEDCVFDCRFDDTDERTSGYAESLHDFVAVGYGHAR